MKDTDRLGNPRKERVNPHGDHQSPNVAYGERHLQRQAVATRTRSEAQERQFEDAKARLSKMTFASAVQFLTTLPVGLLEVYLLAEEAGEGRKEVLSQFPSPGARARETYLGPTTTTEPAAVGA